MEEQSTRTGSGRGAGGKKKGERSGLDSKKCYLFMYVDAPS